MSVPDDALRKVLVQLQGQMQDLSRQHSGTRLAVQTKEREKRATTLTLREIERLPRAGEDAVSVYRGIGRMFMQESRNSVENSLKTKEKEIGEELSALSKKIKYLEGELNQAQSSLRDILQEQHR